MIPNSTFTNDVSSQNTRDISQLTNNVTRLAVMVEHLETRRNEDVATMREATQGISLLNEKISVALGLKPEIDNIKYTVNEIKIAVHDVTAQFNNLEKWRSNLDGAKGALRWIGNIIWAVVGSGVTALLYFLLRNYFASQGVVINGE